MPSFSTPEPISIEIECVVGHVSIVASDRRDTVIEVRASEPTRSQDVRAARDTTVDYSDGRLRVQGPKQRGLFTKVGCIDVKIEVPSGSHVDANASVGRFHSVGRLGDCRVKTSVGDHDFEHTGPVNLHTSAGSLAVGHASGDATMSTGTGKVRVGDVEGSAVVKNSNGRCWIGRVTGELTVNAANGDISIERAQASVTARTANGDIRVGELVRGAASLKTACGEIEVGIHEGSAARLDVHTSFGRILNRLESIASPSSTEDRLEVQARTAYGDIVVHHSQLEGTPAGGPR